MPKQSHRCNRRGRFGGPPPASLAFMVTPRQVSFEDNHHDSDSDTGSPVSTCSNPVLMVLTEQPTPRLMRKPTLVRPKPSLSLVDLAKSTEAVDDEDTIQQTAQSSSLSAPVSPITCPQEVDLSSSPQLPGSPWGHFVDMVIPNEETRPGPHHYHDAPCSCCSACRRKRGRGSPYGEYKKTNKHRPLCFFQDSAARQSKQKTIVTRFRLSPRKEPTDQLIGALDRLQFD